MTVMMDKVHDQVQGGLLASSEGPKSSPPLRTRWEIHAVNGRLRDKKKNGRIWSVDVVTETLGMSAFAANVCWETFSSLKKFQAGGFVSSRGSLPNSHEALNLSRLCLDFVGPRPTVHLFERSI